MISDKTDAISPPLTPSQTTKSAAGFFRQSGWMLFASTASGCFMYAVHKVANQIPKSEYGAFMTLLQVLSMMTTPALGLQLVFAHQTVSAITPDQRQQLVGTIRGVLGAAVIVWLVLVGVIFYFQHDLTVAYKVANPAAIWATVCLALMSAVLPVMNGLLQGKMDFLWLGWANMLNGLGRFAAIALIVLVFGGWAAGAMTGALIGMLVALAIAAWHTKEVWRGPSQPIRWRPWLGQVVPLTLGFGAATVMLSWDMIVVRRFFPADESGFYGAAGMIGRALVFLTAPLTAVMFPKVAQAAARAEKTDVLARALGATALLGGVAALSCTILPELPLRIVYNESFLRVAPLVPWFAWCMLPLTLANVLINNLLAHRRFAVVPWLALVAVGYAVVLWLYHDSFRAVVQTLGLFALLFFGVSVFFTFKPYHRSSTPASAPIS